MLLTSGQNTSKRGGKKKKISLAIESKNFASGSKNKQEIQGINTMGNLIRICVRSHL